MALIGRHFGLSETRSGSVSCGADGAFVGEVPLLERSRCRADFQQWQPRPVDDLNRDLSKRYRLPVDINAKVGGLIAIARAFNRGDLFHAQIVALHLQFPDPPALKKTAKNAREIVELARQLRASGLLKDDWDPLKHPRWPAGSPGNIGIAPPLLPRPSPSSVRQEERASAPSAFCVGSGSVLPVILVIVKPSRYTWSQIDQSVTPRAGTSLLTQHLPSLDGWRALSILLVLAHCDRVAHHPAFLDLHWVRMLNDGQHLGRAVLSTHQRPIDHLADAGRARRAGPGQPETLLHSKGPSDFAGLFRATGGSLLPPIMDAISPNH